MAERKLIDGVTISWAPGVLPESGEKWVSVSATGVPAVYGIPFFESDDIDPGAFFINPRDFVIVDGVVQKASDPRPNQAK